MVSQMCLNIHFFTTKGNNSGDPQRAGRIQYIALIELLPRRWCTLYKYWLISVYTFIKNSNTKYGTQTVTASYFNIAQLIFCCTGWDFESFCSNTVV